MADTYFTITAPIEGIYKEKGSKFLSFALPVRTEAEVKELVKQYRKTYYDARHVCYAYVLGAERTAFRANDDGEPSGTAGKPILGQLNSQNLTNVLVIVVRYFGGILLGTGGLVVAYREATADALAQAEIVERSVECAYKITFSYAQMNSVMKIVKDEKATIIANKSEMECTIDVLVCKANEPRFTEKMKNLLNVRIENLM